MNVNIIVMIVAALFGPNAMDFRHDVNDDCVVNVLDILVIRTNLGKKGSSISPVAADINRDGVCNVLDLMAVRSQLGTVLERVVVTKAEVKVSYYIRAYEDGTLHNGLWSPMGPTTNTYVGKANRLNSSFLRPLFDDFGRHYSPKLFSSVEEAEDAIKHSAWHNREDTYEVYEHRMVSRWKITRNMGLSYP